MQKSKEKSTAKVKPKASKESIPSHQPQKKTDKNDAVLPTQKITILQSATLQQDAEAVVSRLQKKSEQNNNKDLGRPRISDVIKFHLDDLEILAYMIRVKLAEEQLKGNSIEYFWQRHCPKNQVCLDSLHFYQFIRNLLPNIGHFQKYVDTLFFICRNSLFKKVSKVRFQNVIRLSERVNVLSLRIKSSVNILKRQSFRLALLHVFHRHDLDMDQTIPLSLFKRTLAEYDLDLTEQEYDYMISKKLIFSRDGDQHVSYKGWLEIAFENNQEFRECCYAVFSRIIMMCVRKAFRPKKTTRSALQPTSKTSRSTKVTMEDFVKRAKQKPKDNTKLTKMCRQIVGEIISAIQLFVYETVRVDQNTTKDVIIVDKVDQFEHSNLLPRLWASNSYGRSIHIDNDMNIIQYDLASTAELPRLNIRPQCPITKSELLDILLTDNNHLFLLTDDWNLWIWELTSHTYKQKIQVCRHKTNLSRFRRFNNLYPKFLVQSQKHVVVNHSFSDSCLTIIDKQLLAVMSRVKIGRRQQGLTLSLFEKALQFDNYVRNQKEAVESLMKITSKEDLKRFLEFTVKGQSKQLLDYLSPSDSCKHDEILNLLNIIVSKFRSSKTLYEIRVYDILATLSKYYTSYQYQESQEEKAKFNEQNVAAFIFKVNKKAENADVDEFWRFISSNSINSFSQLRQHILKMDIKALVGQSYYSNLLLIFIKAVENGCNVREELSRIDHHKTKQVTALGLKQLLLRLQLALTEQQIDSILELQEYSGHGLIMYDRIVNDPQFIAAESKNIYKHDHDYMADVGTYYLPEVGVQDLVLVDPLNLLMITTVFPSQSTITLYTMTQRMDEQMISTFVISRLKHKGCVPPLIYYEKYSGFLISADKVEGISSDIYIWDLNFRDVTKITSILEINPIKIVRNCHNSAVVSICYLPSSQTVVTSATDNTVKIWDPVMVEQKAKRKKVRLKPGYYSYLGQEMLQSCFSECKKMLVKSTCYVLQPAVLTYKTHNQLEKTELCLMHFSSAIKQRTINQLSVYAISRLKLEIKESKREEQIPKKLMDMLQEHAQNKRRKMLNFRICSIPVLPSLSPLQQLYKNLMDNCHINMSYTVFLKKIEEYKRKQSRPKIDFMESPVEIDPQQHIDRKLVELINCRHNLKKIIPERPKIRRQFMLYMHTQKNHGEMTEGQFKEFFHSSKSKLINEVFSYYNVDGVLKVNSIIKQLFNQKEIASWKRFLYNLSLAKSRIYYSGRFESLQDKSLFLALLNELEQDRQKILEEYIGYLDNLKLKRLFARIPMHFQIVVPRFHRQMQNQFKKGRDCSSEFRQLMDTCRTDDMSEEQLNSYMKRQLMPEQSIDLKQLLRNISQEKMQKIRKLCQSSELQVELPLFVNFIEHNTSINRGTLLDICLQEGFFDYRQLDDIFTEAPAFSDPNKIMLKIVQAAKKMPKQITISEMLQEFKENNKIHLRNFEKWLEVIKCELTPTEKNDYFVKYLKADNMNYASLARLEQALSTASTGASVTYQKQSWQLVFDTCGQLVVEDFKRHIANIKELIQKQTKSQFLPVQMFYASAVRTSRPKKAQIFTKIAYFGSLFDLQSIKSNINKPFKIPQDALINLQFLEIALRQYKPSSSYEPSISIQPDVALLALPYSSLTIPVGELDTVLSCSDPYIGLKESTNIKKYLERAYGQSIPIEYLVPDSRQLREVCSRNVGYAVILSGQPLEYLFKKADLKNQGIISENGCISALELVCSAYEASIFAKVMDFNKQMMTLDVFREQLERLAIRPVRDEMKRAFIYKLYDKNKVHYLQELQHRDIQKTGRLPFEQFKKAFTQKGNNLHGLLLYNWNSSRFISMSEAMAGELEYKPVVDSIQQDYRKFQRQIEAYRDSLRNFLSNTLNELDATLFELCYVKTQNTGGVVTPRIWYEITGEEWYFLEKNVNYYRIVKHMKGVSAQLIQQSNSLSYFADLIHKKSCYYEVFRYMDTDNTNSVDLNEFIVHCTNLKINLSNEKIKQIFQKISQLQRTFNYDQFIQALTPFIQKSDRNDWVFNVKRAINNELIKVDKETLKNPEKLYGVLKTASCQHFMNLCHNKQDIEELLSSVNICEMLLKRFETIMLAKQKRKEVADKALFEKLLNNYMASYNLSKKQRKELWETYVNSKAKSTRRPIELKEKQPQQVEAELQVQRILEMFKNEQITEAMNAVGVTKFTKITPQNIKELSAHMGLLIPNNQVDLILKIMKKTTFKDILSETMSSKLVDLHEGSSVVLLNQIKQSVRYVCQHMDITLEELFKWFLKTSNTVQIKQANMIALLVFTLGLKKEHAESLYYYLDEDRNGDISLEQWVSKFVQSKKQVNPVTRADIYKKLDIHGNGYICSYELKEIIKVGQMEESWVNINQWINAQKYQFEDSEEMLTIPKIKDEKTLVESLVDQEVSVYPKEQGAIVEMFCNYKSGITLKGLERALASVGVTLSQEDKDYFMHRFGIKVSPTFMNLKKVIAFLRRHNQRIVYVENHEPFLKFVASLRNTMPNKFLKTRLDKNGNLLKSQFFKYLGENGLRTEDAADVCRQLLDGEKTQTESFLAKFKQAYRSARTIELRNIENNIERCASSVYTVLANVYKKLSEKYECDEFWEGVTQGSNDLMNKMDFTKLLIKLGFSECSSEDIDTFFYFIDTNRNNKISYYEWADFWLACRNSIKVVEASRTVSKIQSLEADIVASVGGQIAQKCIRPMKVFSECDLQQKGFLNMQEFRNFLKIYQIKITEKQKLEELARTIDRSAKTTIRYVPLMASISKYADVFSRDPYEKKQAIVFNRDLIELFHDITMYEFRLFDQDYDDILEQPQLYSYCWSKLGKRQQTKAYQLTQFIRDKVGLKIEDIYKFALKYNEQVQQPETPQPELLKQLQDYFNPMLALKGFSNRFNQHFKHFTLNYRETQGIWLISRTLYLQAVHAVMDSCLHQLSDIANFIVNVIINKFTNKTFRIRISDDSVQALMLKNEKPELPEQKQLKFTKTQQVNPFIEVYYLKDTGHRMIKCSSQATEVVGSDNHDIDYHITNNRHLYELDISLTKVEKCSQLIATEFGGKSIEQTICKLGGLIFNPCFKHDFGLVARGWACQILKMLKSTHDYGLIGLIRRGNIVFKDGVFGYRHMFMALRVDDQGLARCGLDHHLSEICLDSFPEFNGDMEQPEMQKHILSVWNVSMHAPEIRKAKQLSSLTPAIDIYAFGILLYILLFGEQPLSAKKQHTEQGLWTNRRIFDTPLLRLMDQEELLQVWSETVNGDIGRAISNHVECSEDNRQALRDVINVIEMCLRFEWFERPTVDNLLSTIFNGVSGSQYFHYLESAEELYAPQLLLQSLISSIRQFVIDICQDVVIITRKIDLLKIINQLSDSIGKHTLLQYLIEQQFIDQLLFVIISLTRSENKLAAYYPIDVVRSEMIEIVQSYRNLIQKLATVCDDNEYVLRLFVKSYLNEPFELLSDERDPLWLQQYQNERLEELYESMSYSWNQIMYNIIAPAYRKILSRQAVDKYLVECGQDQHLKEFELKSKLETLQKQMKLQVNKSKVYYWDIISIAECLRTLQDCSKDDNQTKRSALKIVLNYTKSMIESHDINKIRALLDSRIGYALANFATYKNQEIRNQVLHLYYLLSLGFRPTRLHYKSTEEVHKSLGVLHHLMSNSDRTDKMKFQQYSNNYYGFKAQIIKSILRRICQCFSLTILTAIFSEWTPATISVFRNLIHSDTATLEKMNSPTIEAFSNFYTFLSKQKQPQKDIHDEIIGLNNRRLMKMLQSNIVVCRIVSKLGLAELKDVHLHDISNRYVLLLNYYNKHCQKIVQQLAALTLSKYDPNSQPKTITQLQLLRKQLMSLLDLTIRHVRDCPSDMMLLTSQLLVALSALLHRIIHELSPFQQLSLNVELIIVRAFTFYEEVMYQEWDFFFTPELLTYLVEQLFAVYSYHGNIDKSQVQLSIYDMKAVKQLTSPDNILEYVLKHELLRKFMQNRMSQAANSLMRCFISAMDSQLQGRLYSIGFVDSFCRIAKWQYSLIIAYMKTKTENLHVLHSYVEEANFRIRIFDIIVSRTSLRFQNEFIKSNFIEYIVHTLLQNTYQFDMRFYRSSQAFLPFRYSIPLRNQALSMLTSIFWHRPEHIYKQLISQMLKHNTIKKQAEIMAAGSSKDMKVLDSLWLFSHIFESGQTNLLREADNYAVRNRINKLIEDRPEIGTFYPSLSRLL